jgi:hypothetical protein
MKKRTLIAFAAAGLALMGAAAAHPGPELLTAGGAEARAAMTPGMSYEDVGGVHVFRGAPTPEPEPEHALAGAPYPRTININVTHRYVLRAFRPLRTRGFYSGPGMKSRRYTQGFYSSD